MKNKYTGFFSEHTAEYLLVSRLKNIIGKEFMFVTPVFPWLSREGGSLAQYLHRDDRLFVIGFYPKRPKFSIDSAKIQLKVNEEFFLGSKEGRKLGIPIILGCVIARDLWELNDNAQFIWLNLDNREYGQFEFVSNSEGKVSKSDLEANESFMSEAAVINLIRKNCVKLSYKGFIDGSRRVKDQSPYHYMGGAYRPVYMLIKT